MINFSSLKSSDVSNKLNNTVLNNLSRSKSVFLKTLSESTGLSVEYLDPIFESKLYESDDNVDAVIENMWDEYINYKTQQTDIDKMDKEFILLLNMFNKRMSKGQDTMSLIPKNRVEINKKRSFMHDMLSWIKRQFGYSNTDDALDIMMSLLQMKNIDKRNQPSYKMLYEGYKPRIEQRLQEKYGDDFINIKNNAVDNFKNLSIGSQFTEENVYFYKDLKYMMADVWKSCDSDERKNTYQLINEFINNGIDYYTTKSNVQQSDETTYYDFIYSLVNSPSLNIMYQSPDYLKTVTSDFQQLLSDLVKIVDTYIKNSQKYMDYVDVAKISNYTKSMYLLKQSIASSVENSDIKNIDLNNLGRYQFNRVSGDCLLIIKAIQNEFNIKIRKIINLYITATLELLHTLAFMETRLNNFRFVK